MGYPGPPDKVVAIIPPIPWEMNSLLRRQKVIEYFDFLARDFLIELVGDFGLAEIIAERANDSEPK